MRAHANKARHGAESEGRRRPSRSTRLPAHPTTQPTHLPFPLARWQGSALFGTALFAGCAALFCVPAYFVRSGFVIAGDKQKESAEHILALDVNAIQRKTDAARPSNAATTEPPASR